MASDPHARMSTAAHRFFQDRAMRPPNVAESLIIQALAHAVQEEMAREPEPGVGITIISGEREPEFDTLTPEATAKPKGKRGSRK